MPDMDQPPQVRYKKIGDALKKSGRTIVLNMCEWGLNNPAEVSDNSCSTVVVSLLFLCPLSNEKVSPFTVGPGCGCDVLARLG